MVGIGWLGYIRVV